MADSESAEKWKATSLLLQCMIARAAWTIPLRYQIYAVFALPLYMATPLQQCRHVQRQVQYAVLLADILVVQYVWR